MKSTHFTQFLLSYFISSLYTINNQFFCDISLFARPSPYAPLGVFYFSFGLRTRSMSDQWRHSLVAWEPYTCTSLFGTAFWIKLDSFSIMMCLTGSISSMMLLTPALNSMISSCSLLKTFWAELLISILCSSTSYYISMSMKRLLNRVWVLAIWFSVIWYGWRPWTSFCICIWFCWWF